MLFPFENYVLVVEVTLTTSSRQEAAEGEPVRRHVANIVRENTGVDVYGLFIAPRIDNNTAETFRTGVWYRDDEIDLVNIVLIGNLINELLEKDCPIRFRKCMGLIITHTGHILNYVNARNGYVMIDGRIGCGADPHEILATIKERGYEECVQCLLRNRQGGKVC